MAPDPLLAALMLPVQPVPAAPVAIAPGVAQPDGVTAPGIAAGRPGPPIASGPESAETAPARPAAPAVARAPSGTLPISLGVDPPAVQPAPAHAAEKPDASVSVPVAGPPGQVAPPPAPPPAPSPDRPAGPAPPPAAQAAPMLIAAATHPSGVQHLTIRLSPPELGSLQVRIEQAPDAPAKVEITVQHAQTLDLLLRDQNQLHQALDQAGVPPEGRSVAFTLAGQDSPAWQGSGQGRAGPDGAGTWLAGDAPQQDKPADVAVPLVWRRAGLDVMA